MNQHVDFNSSFVLCPTQGGVKLLRPEENLSLPTLHDVFNRQINTFFLSPDHVILDVNDVQLDAFSLACKKDMVGADLTKFSKNKEHIQKIHSNNLSVLHTQRLSICDEDVNLADESEIVGISIKMPWYDAEDKLAGIFGFSSIFKDGKYLTKSADFIDTYNFFKGQDFSFEEFCSKKMINGVYFTDRELTVVKHVMMGKTLREIAAIQCRSIRTIESHFATIKSKLRVKTRSAVIDAMHAYFNLSK